MAKHLTIETVPIDWRVMHLPTDRKGRIYIAGPMSDLPDHNFPAFHKAEAELVALGWTVLNPAHHGLIEGACWHDYLRWDIAMLATCEAIFLLPGWSKSAGALLELHIARELEMQILLHNGAEAGSSSATDKAIVQAGRSGAGTGKTFTKPSGPAKFAPKPYPSAGTLPNGMGWREEAPPEGGE